MDTRTSRQNFEPRKSRRTVSDFDLHIHTDGEGKDTWDKGVVHAWVGQKLLNCYIFKSFYERSSLANFHVSAWCKSSIISLTA
jgi:hypothetical protein